MLLPLLECHSCHSNSNDSHYDLDELVIRYNDHPSILAIKNKCMELNSTFTFQKVDKEQIYIAIKRLGSKKFQNPMIYYSELSRNLVTFSEESLSKTSMNA